MDESSEQSPGERASQQGDDAQTPGKEPVEESAATGAAPQPQAAAGHADERKLPVVWSPRLDAGEETAEEPQADAHEDISSSADEPMKDEPAAAALPRTSRFALLAASVALAAALGSFVGSLSASGIAQLWPAAAAKPGIAEAANPAQVRKAELAELAALKANLEGATRGANSQFAKLADRLDRIERAELDPAAKLAHIADAVDRLEKRTAAAAAPPAPETTGSIAPNPPPAAEAKQPDKVLHDWIVQDVRGNRALVENRYGGVFAVTAGSVLPGLGRVETIKRQDGEWLVVTERGIISSEP